MLAATSGDIMWRASPAAASALRGPRLGAVVAMAGSAPKGTEHPSCRSGAMLQLHRLGDLRGVDPIANTRREQLHQPPMLLFALVKHSPNECFVEWLGRLLIAGLFALVLHNELVHVGQQTPRH